MQHITIEEVLKSTPDSVRDALRGINIHPTFNPEEDIKTLLSLYSGFNMLSPGEKKIVNKSINKSPFQFHSDMILYLDTNNIFNALGLFKHIQDFVDIQYQFELKHQSINQYIDIKNVETGKLLQRLQVGMYFNSMQQLYVYHDNYLYVWIYHFSGSSRITQYHNDGTSQNPNFVLTDKFYSDILSFVNKSKTISMKMENKYLVLIRENGVIEYIDPYAMILIKSE